MHKKKKQSRLAAKIKRLTLGGLRQVEVARLCRISTVCARKYQRMQNLATRQSRNGLQVKRETGGGEGLHDALLCVDAIFGKGPLPFEPTRDHDTATAMLEGFARVLAQHCPDVYARSTERDLEEFRSNLSEALRVKRICGATAGTVH